MSTETPHNSPQIAAFIGDETVQYFVIIEHRVLCQVPTFQHALFIAFSAFYVFHLEYPKTVKNAMFFLQDYVLAFPDSMRRPATYLATASDIKSFPPPTELRFVLLFLVVLLWIYIMHIHHA